MPGLCLRHTDIPNTSRLFADFTYHFDRVAKFYRHSPWSPDSLRSAAAALDYPAERRAAAVSALREQNPDSARSLELLSRPDTVAVVTGQQVGLFGGPAYTIYKALTAVRWAETLTAHGIPAVPVFWLATEDHDFPEVNHAWNFTAAMQPVRLEVDAPGAGARPVGGIAIDQYPLSALRQTLAAFPYGDDVVAMVREAYVDGSTLGDAFVALLRRLLPPDCGLLYLDPMKPAIRQIAAPLLARAASQGAALTRRVLERNAELEAASIAT
jgi:uncharacterized protein YllA (UPF0747 family)